MYDNLLNFWVNRIMYFVFYIVKGWFWMKFNEESPFWRFATMLADFILLNLFVIVISIPIVTIGPVLAALFYTMMKFSENEDGYLVKTFWNELKHLFFVRVAVSLIYTAIIAATVYVIQFWYSFQNIFGMMLAIVFFLFLCMTITAMLISLARTQYFGTIKSYIRDGYLFIFIALKEAVAILAIPVILIGFSIFQETVLYFMGIIGISLMGYALAPLFHKIFSKVEKKHEV